MQISLTVGWLPTTTIALAFATLLGSIAWQRRAALRQLLVGIPVTGALVGIVAIVDDGLALVPYQFPNSYYLWVGLVVLAIVWFVLGWWPRSWIRRCVSFLSIVFTALMALTLINQNYGYYPTVSALFGQNAQHQVDNAQLQQAQKDFRRTGELPDQGFTLQVTIPGTVSHFTTRPAFVWLPPSWVASPTPHLPVIELMSGTPGTPADWVRAGYADRTARQFAAGHDGVAPILVMPDVNGSDVGDTECVDSPAGNAETYLTVDVPAWVRRTYAAQTTPRSIATAGLSEGGMCAMMLALRHPDIYTAFADFSGLTSPTVGEVVDPAATVPVLFGGSRAAYDAHDPPWLLRHQTFPGLGGWFSVGAQDAQFLPAQRELVPLARAAGIATCHEEFPGGHDYQFWTAAFQRALPWLADRLGVAPLRTAIPACEG